MIYVTAHYVDAHDGIPATVAPLRNGPALPSDQLTVDAVDMREEPPLIIGSLPDGTDIPAACSVVDEATHTALMDSFTAWRAGLDVTLKAQTLAALADHRYTVETGGIDIGGQRILTDRESQAQLNGALQALTSGFVGAVDWKAASGWVTVTLEVILPIGSAVAQHVQACFTAERRVAEAFAAGTLQIGTLDAFDAQLAVIKAGATG